MTTQLGSLHPFVGLPTNDGGLADALIRTSPALDAPKSSSKAPAARILEEVGALPPGPCRAPRARPSYILFLICSDRRDMLFRNQTRKGEGRDGQVHFSRRARCACSRGSCAGVGSGSAAERARAVRFLRPGTILVSVIL